MTGIVRRIGISVFIVVMFVLGCGHNKMDENALVTINIAWGSTVSNTSRIEFTVTTNQIRTLTDTPMGTRVGIREGTNALFVATECIPLIEGLECRNGDTSGNTITFSCQRPRLHQVTVKSYPLTNIPIDAKQILLAVGCTEDFPFMENLIFQSEGCKY